MEEVTEPSRWPRSRENYAPSSMPAAKRNRLQALPCRSEVVPGTTQTARSLRAVIVLLPLVAVDSWFAYLTVGDDWKMRGSHPDRS